MGALSDKYCIVGVGQTPFMKASNRSPLPLACEAVTNALDDAGVQPRDVDGLTSFHVGDSIDILHGATALGIRMNYGADLFGGGSSAEAMVAHAIGLIEAGQWDFWTQRDADGRQGARRPGSTDARTGRLAIHDAVGRFSSPAQWLAADRLLVMDGSRLAGLITRSGIARFVQMQATLSGGARAAADS